MAWTTPAAPVTGTAISTTTFGLPVLANFAVIGGAWTAYTPAITTGGSAITIGNGTIDAAYKQIDKTVNFRITLTVGSTTVLPAGAYAVPLPVAAKITNGAAGAFISAAPNRQGVWRATPATTMLLYEAGTVASATVASLGTISGTILIITGSYEAA